MFTGIIETIGTVSEVKTIGGDVRLTVRAPKLDWTRVRLGDSIATNGICLTVIEKLADGFRADVSRETLSLTTLGNWKSGTQVNLEQALTPESRLGGHIVSGHVDGIGEVISRHGDARSERLQIRAPDSLAKYIAHKGSITVDGTSLTVNAVNGAVFDLNIVPHTLKETVIQHYHVGTQVNLEVDVIARYLERLLMGDKAAQPEKPGITPEFLAQNGFYK
ncbi:riboflavin synthase [Saccharophagus sp. K07]|jgi:riboflavin synthase|uniref:riboflavin synthase n=1 Tax=Saccharophagus sp. K07 TaxID=2283636 RepID=UPI001651CB06|nr:riboflavin synthase [Saccharophagus sp. K07]MBC6904024.1 riboflavin synthase [Saccharophagus sp. K07]